MTDRAPGPAADATVRPTSSGSTGDWGLVVPVKVLADAKSRLALPAAVREQLALAFVTDTLSALAGSGRVSNLVVVTNDAAVAEVAVGLGGRAVAEPDSLPAPGVTPLNAAVAAGLSQLPQSSRSGSAGVVLGDLPALRPVDVQILLDAVTRGHQAVVVPDAEGTGSTALLAPSAVALPPLAFGPASAARHVQGGAVAATWAPPRFRQDVDRLRDLAVVQALGVGPATASVLTLPPPVTWTAATVIEVRSGGSVSGAPGGAVEAAVPVEALAGSHGLVLDDGRLLDVGRHAEVLAALRPGQRVLAAIQEQPQADARQAQGDARQAQVVDVALP